MKPTCIHVPCCFQFVNSKTGMYTCAVLICRWSVVRGSAWDGQISDVWHLLFCIIKPRTSHHRSPGEGRCGKKKRSMISINGWERDVISRTNIGTVSKTTLENLPRDGVECTYGLFWVHRYHLELNWKINEQMFCLTGCWQFVSHLALVTMLEMFWQVIGQSVFRVLIWQSL